MYVEGKGRELIVSPKLMALKDNDNVVMDGDSGISKERYSSSVRSSLSCLISV